MTMKISPSNLRSVFPVVASLLFTWWPAHAEVPARSGEQLYGALCMDCHGRMGEGVKGKYKESLAGDWSVEKLARYVTKNMPEDKPELCVGDEAIDVAKYLHDAFYSVEARARNHSSRITLNRLTNRQYRESVADLFRREVGEPKKREAGLNASYFDSKGMNKKDALKHERVDQRIDFNFGGGSPIEGIKPEQFSIAWEGSLRARETGYYEFRVITPNGVRLYLNVNLKEGDKNYRDDGSKESQHALIDAWVSSGNEDRTETARLFLLGGRDYPLRLDYFKYKEKKGAIRLEWLPPNGAWSVPSDKDFSTHMPSRSLVVQTPFPADDRSMGYERGSLVSKDWLDAATRAAIEVANQVDQNLGILSGTRQKDADKARHLKRFATEFMERAFRRPLSKEERMRYLDARFEESESPEMAVKRIVLFTLKSPYFLYPDLPTKKKPDSHRVAARLSLGLWDSLPDQPLDRAARAGKLNQRSEVSRQAKRMLNDSRTRTKVQGFFHHWLDVDSERDQVKDPTIYPNFNGDDMGALRHSLNLFLKDLVWSESSDYRQLLLAQHLHLNASLAELYGKKVGGEGFTRVEFDPQQRAGLITHPYLLSSFAYPNNSSPIHRGVFLTRQMMGRSLKPPPQAVAFKDAELDPTLTMREKVTQVTKGRTCMGCHGTINSLGFSLENYDGLGRWRHRENEKPVDATTDYETVDGKIIRLQGARSLAEFAAGNEEAQKAFVGHLFRYMIKQPARAYGKSTLENLHRHFKKSSFNVKELIIEILCVASMHGLEKENS
ncbi:MAG: DUF1592 domain-containing protein [Opitutales bacterium]